MAEEDTGSFEMMGDFSSAPSSDFGGGEGGGQSFSTSGGGAGSSGQFGGSIAGIISNAIGGIFGGIRTAVARKKEERALRQNARNQIPGVLRSLDMIEDMVAQNEIDETEALARLDSLFSGISADLSGAYKQALDSGMKSIQENTDRALSNIQFNLREAKERASGAEKREIERYEKQVNDVRQEFQKSNKQLSNQMARRRLAGSGAMIAALRKSQETMGRVEADLREQSDAVISAIGEELGRTERASQFQTGQAQGQAAQSSRELSQGLAQQRGREIAGLGLQRGQQEEAARAGFRAERQQLGFEEQALENALARLVGESQFTSGRRAFGNTAQGQQQTADLIERTLETREFDESV